MKHTHTFYIYTSIYNTALNYGRRQNEKHIIDNNMAIAITTIIIMSKVKQQQQQNI